MPTFVWYQFSSGASFCLVLMFVLCAKRNEFILDEIGGGREGDFFLNYRLSILQTQSHQQVTGKSKCLGRVWMELRVEIR